MVDCLRELSPVEAQRIAATLAEARAVRDVALDGQLRRAGLLLQAISRYCGTEGRTGSGAVHRAAVRLRELINEFAFENVPLESIYGRLEVSSAHAETLFRSAFGLAPTKYRAQLRLRRARELLISTQMNVSEVAGAVGFADPLYFSRVFKRNLGATPSSLIRDFSHRRCEPARLHSGRREPEGTPRRAAPGGRL